jgi:hypothetical protein
MISCTLYEASVPSSEMLRPLGEYGAKFGASGIVLFHLHHGLARIGASQPHQRLPDSPRPFLERAERRTLRRKSDSSCTAGAVHTWPEAEAMANIRSRATVVGLFSECSPAEDADAASITVHLGLSLRIADAALNRPPVELGSVNCAVGDRPCVLLRRLHSCWRLS